MSSDFSTDRPQAPVGAPDETGELLEIPSTEECWDAVRITLRQRLSDFGYRAYVDSATVLSADEDRLRLGYDNELKFNVAQETYRQEFEDELLRAANRPIRVELELCRPENAPAAPRLVRATTVEEALQSRPRLPVDPAGPGEPPAARRRNNGLDVRHTFDAFVVGASNQFAHAACKAVADAPGKAYNPVFIWGGSGLGKTHLMQAVGNKALADKPSLRVLYVTSEQWTNELIFSIQNKRMPEFRKRYRECDILLLDDIQFIATRKATEEEFFHTFNALHAQGSQIIVTSDKVPNELDGMEQRLRSRFAWGLLADVQPPEMETRLAILRAKASAMQLAVPDEVLQYLAVNIRQNVRELEGSLVRIAAYSNHIKAPLTPEVCKDLLKSSLVNRGEKMDCEQIIKACADWFRVSVADIKGPVREKQIARARQAAMYLSRKITKLSYPELGKRFGKDHSTVLTADRRVPELMADDPDFRHAVDSLERELSASM